MHSKIRLFFISKLKKNKCVVNVTYFQSFKLKKDKYVEK